MNTAKKSIESEEVIFTIESTDNILLTTTLRKPACKVCLPGMFTQQDLKGKKKILMSKLSFLRL